MSESVARKSESPENLSVVVSFMLIRVEIVQAFRTMKVIESFLYRQNF